MTPKIKLSEQSMQAMEAKIPELADAALKRAYYQALTHSGKVLEAVNGNLVETVSGRHDALHSPVAAFHQGHAGHPVHAQGQAVMAESVPRLRVFAGPNRLAAAGGQQPD